MQKELETVSELTQLKLSFNKYPFNTSSYGNKMSNRITYGIVLILYTCVL